MFWKKIKIPARSATALQAWNNRILRWLLYAVAIFFIIAVILVLTYFIYENKYEGKIYPRVYLGNINLSALTTKEAEEILNQKINKINQDGLKFIYNKQATTIMPIMPSFEMDLIRQTILFDAASTIEQAFGENRGDNFLNNLMGKIKNLFIRQNISVSFKINEAEIKKILTKNYEEFANPAADAKLIATSTKEKISFAIQKEKIGKIINYDQSIKKLKINLANLNNSLIKLYSKSDYPDIYKNEGLNIETRAQNIIAQAPLTLIYEGSSWLLDKESLAGWLALKRNDQDDIVIGLNKTMALDYIEKNIAPEINKEALDARFKMKDGRVVEFQGSRDGLSLEVEATLSAIENEFINNGKEEITLITKILKSSVKTDEVNDLGIKEIIGTGYSNFAGSPKNRRHNIRTGAAAINGLLIKPGEEFSLMKALGEIEASTGYLPELVIKGNETIPEYGGGLCQIGTTMFRTALASGLPITARRNHSYRVPYYEPAGTDATIYDPWPDFRFINDTKNDILIQTRIEGDDLYFDLWGTKDARLIEQTEPVIYNITKPGPTKYIETLDLPVGEKKCTERAHNGADAYFDYKVTYPATSSTSTPVIKEERFSSHYIPWQEVCLIGVETLTASSTEEIIE